MLTSFSSKYNTQTDMTVETAMLQFEIRIFGGIPLKTSQHHRPQELKPHTDEHTLMEMSKRANPTASIE